MSKKRPFRFGVALSGASSRQEWVDKVRRVEELGYSAVQLPDHLIDQFSPAVALMLAAEVSSTLRLSTCVFDNNFRHLAIFAKEIATLDVLSEGRVELGLGAGWQEVEYRQAGIPFDPAGVRVGRYEEAIHVLKKLFADGPVTYSGRYYTLDGLESLPKPLQRPHPPFMLAGGSKRTLSIAGREADIVTINPKVLPDGNNIDMQDATLSATYQKIAWIREAAGDRFDEIELAILVLGVVITEGKDLSGPLQATGLSAMVAGDQPLQGIYVLAGSVDQICEQVLANREHFGLSYISVFEKDMEAFAPVVERLAGK
jgi:probable F420-dependent oxidoreductase